MSGLTALLLVGCSTPPALTITVVGMVTLGPFCPVEQVGTPCPIAPGAFADAEVSARQADVEIRTPISPSGDFTLELSAGTWQVTANAGMSCATLTVSHSGPVSIDCDTGIR